MKQKKALLTVALYTLTNFFFFIYAQKPADSLKYVYKPPVVAKDNPIAAALDSIANLRCFEKSTFTTETSKLNKYKFAPGYVPVYPDSVYAERIAKLNAKSPFGLVYNQDVKSFIDLYAVKKPKLTARTLGLAELYFPFFEEMLDKYKMPLELKYLAVVESALNPVAKSPAGAAGLWQFMYTTGKMYDLKVDSYVDERLDPYQSTIAACQHMTDLYKIYKDWSLVLAAYNSGAGNVNKAIRKSGGEMDFWKIKKFLPKETQGYVPAFIAVVYVMNYSAEHNIFPVAPIILNDGIDTIIVKQKLTFAQISEYLNIPLDVVTYLNPCFKEGVIPSYADDKYALRLPKKYMGSFLSNEDSIYKFRTKAEVEKEKLLALKIQEQAKKDSVKKYSATYASSNYTKPDTTKVKTNVLSAGNTRTVYTVKAGDGLGIIASKYTCTISNILVWNNLKSQSIYPGQKLFVEAPLKTENIVENKIEKKDTVTMKVENKTIAINKNISQINVKYHVVQKGDTLWGIASKYKGASVETIKKLNNLNAASTLYVGQKLKIQIEG
jgi:membrane-bound lytic murein transglycosylase D